MLKFFTGKDTSLQETFWFRLVPKIEKKLEEYFAIQGKFVALHVRLVLLLSFIFIGFSFFGYLKFKILTTGSDLWVPLNSKATDNEVNVRKNYAPDERVEQYLYEMPNGQSILTKTAFDAMFDMYDNILSLKAGSDDTITYDAICSRDGRGKCQVLGPLRFFDHNRTIYETTVTSDDDILTAINVPTYPDGTPVVFDQVFGKIQFTTLDQVSSASAALQMLLVIGGNEDVPSQVNDQLAWELDFLQLGLDASSSSSLSQLNSFQESGMKIFRSAQRSLDDELARAVGADVPLLLITYILMMIFTCMTLGRGRPPINTRVSLGISGVILVILSTLSGYGIASGLGVPFTSLQQLLPFILVGIGVDDMFIIVSTFDQITANSPSSLGIPDRMGLTLRRCGTSIFFTGMTDIIAFGLGAVTTMPAIRYFCLYATLAVTVNFLIMMTTFVAFFCMDQVRMETKEVDVCWCLSCAVCLPAAVSGESFGGLESIGSSISDKHLSVQSNASTVSTANPINTLLSTSTSSSGGASSRRDSGNTNSGRPLSLTSISSVFSSFTPLSPRSRTRTRKNDGREETLSALQAFIETYYVPWILQKPVQIGVICLFLVLFAVGLYGALSVGQGFDVIDIALDNSYQRDFISSARKYNLRFQENFLPTRVYLQKLDFHSQLVQYKIQRMQDNFAAKPKNDDFMVSWLSDLLIFVPSSRVDSELYSPYSVYNGSEQQYWLDVNQFLTEDEYSHYATDIILDNDTQTISKCRILGYHIKVTTSSKQLRAMVEARSVVSNEFSESKAFAFTYYYLFFEQFGAIFEQLLQDFLLCIVSVTIVSAFLLVMPVPIFVLAALVAIVDLELLGLVYFWGLEINSVTGIQLIMAVGLVVDYMAHVMHAFMIQPTVLEQEDRTLEALLEIGPSVLLGSFTTFLGIMPLAGAHSEVFRTYFKMFLGIVILGSLHGLLVMPVIMTLLPKKEVTAVSLATTDHKAFVNKRIRDSIRILELPVINAVKVGQESKHEAEFS